MDCKSAARSAVAMLETSHVFWHSKGRVESLLQGILNVLLSEYLSVKKRVSTDLLARWVMVTGLVSEVTSGEE